LGGGGGWGGGGYEPQAIRQSGKEVDPGGEKSSKADVLDSRSVQGEERGERNRGRIEGPSHRRAHIRRRTRSDVEGRGKAHKNMTPHRPAGEKKNRGEGGKKEEKKKLECLTFATAKSTDRRVRSTDIKGVYKEGGSTTTRNRKDGELETSSHLSKRNLNCRAIKDETKWKSASDGRGEKRLWSGKTGHKSVEGVRLGQHSENGI